MDTSRRLKRKHLEMAQQGKIIGSHRPFGYEEDKTTIRESEASLIRQAADDVLAGMGTHAVARKWNELGIKTAQGNTWVQSVVRKLLVSPRIAGYRVYKKAIALGTDGRPVMAQREPILDIQTWEAMCAVLQDPANHGNNVHRGGRKRLLAGLVRCGLCSVPMSGDKDARRGTHLYVCKPATTHRGCGRIRVAGERVDDLITGLVIKYLSERQVARVRAPWPGESDLDSATDRISELMGAFREGELTGDVVFPSIKQLETRTAALRAEKQSWLREQAIQQSQPNDVAEIWPDLNTDHRRAVIESVLAAVIIKPAPVPGGASPRIVFRLCGGNDASNVPPSVARENRCIGQLTSDPVPVSGFILMRPKATTRKEGPVRRRLRG